MFSKIDQGLAAFDNREGYELTDYLEVGLPIFDLTLIAIVISKHPVGVLEESVLRLIQQGIDDTSGISEILGVSDIVTTGTCAEAIRSGLLVSNKGLFRLAKAGKQRLENRGSDRAKEAVVTCFYDGLRRLPVTVPSHLIYEQRELRSLGVHMIRPIPIRPPHLTEIDVARLTKFAKVLGLGNATSHNVLRLLSFQRRRLKFQRALLGYFKGPGRKKQIRVSIDGVESIDHEVVFSGYDEQQRERCLLPMVAKNSRQRIVAAKRAAGKLLSVSTQPPLGETLSLNKDQNFADHAVASGTAVLVSVYEHPNVLRDAIKTACKRLIIFSPWIRAAVVDGAFLALLRDALQRNVAIWIGFGFGAEKKERMSNEDISAIEALTRLSDDNDNFCFKRLGDTHAKILIKDQEFVVIGSFNWLSFRGDPNRSFREEWSMKCSDQQVVEHSANRFLKRFI